MKIKKGLIVDASYLIQRALHVKELDELKDSFGRKTGAVFQVIRSMSYELEQYPEYFPVFCFDYHQSPRRIQLYPNYKRRLDNVMQREQALTDPVIAEKVKELDEFIENYKTQRVIIIKLLKALGIPCLFFENWEGDDLMYITSKLISDSIIMTDDRDLMQLLSPSVKILRPMAHEFLTYESYQEKHNDPNMQRFLIEKAIVGDTSDNIKGACKGCGAKAAEIISEIMVKNPDTWQQVLSEHRLKKIRDFSKEESIRNFNFNLELIDLKKVEIDEYIRSKVIQELESVSKPDYFKVIKIFAEYEIKEIETDKLVSQLTRLFTSLTY